MLQPKALKTQFLLLLHYLPSWFPQRWKISWISTFPAVCVSLGGEALYEAMKPPWQQDGEVTLECTWTWDHKRRKIAELKDFSRELPPSIPQVLQSCAGVLVDPSCRDEKSRKRYSDASEAERNSSKFPQESTKTTMSYWAQRPIFSWVGWGCLLWSPNPNSPGHSLSQASWRGKTSLRWRGNAREEEEPRLGDDLSLPHFLLHASPRQFYPSALFCL